MPKGVGFKIQRNSIIAGSGGKCKVRRKAVRADEADWWLDGWGVWFFICHLPLNLDFPAFAFLPENAGKFKTKPNGK